MRADVCDYVCMWTLPLDRTAGIVYRISQISSCVKFSCYIIYQQMTTLAYC